MKIAFIGDIHGRIFHTIAALIMWQTKYKEKLDMIIQVGDFAAYPNPDEELLKDKFIQQDPTELDFSKYINANGKLKEDLRYASSYLKCPIYFLRGNHEDFEWLKLISNDGNIIANVDDYNLVQYVPDGKVMEVNGIKVAFLGGIETAEREERSINEDIYNELIDKYKSREIDILVTHDAPYGVAIGFKGQVQGSKKITKLVEILQPKFLIAGHYHHMIGPQHIENTMYLGLSILVPPLRKDESRRVQPGSIAILDTKNNDLKFVTDDWMSSIDKDFDFQEFINALKSGLHT